MTNSNDNTSTRADELKRALLALRSLKKRVAELEHQQGEPVAIVGQSCRLPGGADTPEKFWEMIRDGVDATCAVPADRWDADAIYDPDPEAVGGSYVRRGGFLNEPVDRFDPAFFGISPREASAMDPMHRMFLEMSWEALEDAGIPPYSLDESLTGVFVGLSVSDYDSLQKHSGLKNIHSYRGTGTIASIAAGRISHFLGLQGPNFPVDTACSSGLVAIVLAVEQLRARTCDLALAGATNLMLSPEATVFLCRMRALDADGRCRTFDQSAAGYSRGEGGGVFALKRLSDAQENDDRILAVIRGVACNHDGHSSGLTVPNPRAQRKVIEAALRDAALDPLDIDFVEAHGTATELGDPIELRAMSDVLCQGRSKENPLIIGAVKTNVGHLEAAAGITGVMKVVQSLQHRLIPPHLHLEEPTSHVDWANLPLHVPTKLTEWARQRGPRRAGVSAFGFSGTNAHVIVEEAPEKKKVAARPDRPVDLIAVSARSAGAVRNLASRYLDLLTNGDKEQLQNLATTSTAGRSHLSHRIAAVGRDVPEMIESLRAITEMEDTGIRRAKASSDVEVAFLFTGQGAQTPGMASELWETSAVFREALERCAKILEPHLERDILPILLDPAEASRLNQTQYTQPAMFAFEYALFELWQSWGVEPAYVLGHSLGEYVAATVAGVMTLEDALPLVAMRASLMQALPGDGGMATVFASESVVRKALSGTDDVEIAAINGPENTVISGPEKSLSLISERLSAEDIAVNPLQVSHAFHSKLMEPMLGEFERAMGAVTLSTPQIPIVSNVSGAMMTDAEATDVSRWCRHIREAVRFSDGMKTLVDLGVQHFLEIGPHPTLIGLGMETATSGDMVWIPSAKRGIPHWQQLCQSVGALYQSGYEVDWAGWNGGFAGQRTAGPHYPFERDRYWFTDITGPLDGAGQSGQVSVAGVATKHPLLSTRLDSPVLEASVFQMAVGLDQPTFLHDHKVLGHVVVPGAFFIELLVEGAAESFGSDGIRLNNLTFERPLILRDDDDIVCQVIISPDSNGASSAKFVSRQPGEGNSSWSTHASATVSPLRDRTATANDPIRKTADKSQEKRSIKALYGSIEKRGVHYGPEFRALKSCHAHATAAVGQATLSDKEKIRGKSYFAHPCLVDAGFQLLAAFDSEDANDGSTRLPASIDEIRIFRPLGSECRIDATTIPQSDDDLFVADIVFANADGKACVEIDGYRARPVSESALRKALESGKPEVPDYDVDWESVSPASAEELQDARGTWVLLRTDDRVGDTLESLLTSRGARCISVRPGAKWHKDGDAFVLPDFGSKNWQRLFKSIGFGDSLKAIGGVIHAGSVDSPTDESSLADEIESGVENVLAPLVELLSAGRDGPTPKIRLITQGVTGPNGASPGSWVSGSALWGISPVLQAEHADCDFRTIDLDPGVPADPLILAQALFGQWDEDRVAVRHAGFVAPRLVRSAGQSADPDIRTVPESENYRIDIEQRGSLDALRYLPAERRVPEADEVEIRIRATGLNFRDVLNVLGMYPGDPGPPGVEVAGVVVSAGKNVRNVKVGDRVFGLGNGAFSAYITTPAAGVIVIPAGLSFEEAATIPLAFLTAEWGLVHLAKIQPGERVLVHAAAGGVGQAAVQIVQQAGAEVYATASSPEKWELLRSQGVEHIFSSRDASFADEVLKVTNGEGVDVVLNALTGDMLSKSLKLLRAGGRFIELGKAELLDSEDLKSRDKPVEYCAFDLGSVLIDTPDRFQSLFDGVAGRFTSGELKPLRVVTYRAENVVHAFRFMAQAKHIGKIVVTSAMTVPVGSHPFNADDTYIVTGASGSLAGQLAAWLVACGARKLVLNSRSGPASEIENRLSSGCQDKLDIQWVAGDIAEMSCALDVVAQATGSGRRLGGIFHTAGVLRDGLFMEQDRASRHAVLAAKVQGSWNLHVATMNFDLDHFVLYSSAAATMGGPGQASYAAANAFMGALAERRTRSGLPANAVEWGAWEGDGMAGRLSDNERQMFEQRGMGFLGADEAFAGLGRLLTSNDAARRLIAKFDWPTIRSNVDIVPPYFRAILSESDNGSASHLGRVSALDMAELAAMDNDQRLGALTAYLKSMLEAVLGAKPEQLDASAPLSDLGFDSLMAMDLRNRIEKQLKVVLPVNKLLGNATPAALAIELDKLLATVDTSSDKADGQTSWDEGEI